MAFDTASLLNEAVGRIVIRTQLAPPIVLEQPFAGGAGGGGGLLAVVKPKLELYDPGGALITAVAPAGEPSDVPLVPLLLLAVAAVAAVAVLVSSR